MLTAIRAEKSNTKKRQYYLEEMVLEVSFEI